MLSLYWVAHKVVTSSRLQHPQICSLRGEKLIFLLAIVKKYNICRIEVILYEIFNIKYQKFSIKINLTEVNHKFYLFNAFFFALQILISYHRHIYIILYINYKFWEVFVWLIKDKENKHKEIWSKVNHSFYLLTCAILVHLSIKDIFIFTCSSKLKIIHSSLFLFSKFTYKVGQGLKNCVRAYVTYSKS